MITKKEFIETRDLTEFAREKGTTRSYAAFKKGMRHGI